MYIHEHTVWDTDTGMMTRLDAGHATTRTDSRMKDVGYHPVATTTQPHAPQRQAVHVTYPNKPKQKRPGRRAHLRRVLLSPSTAEPTARHAKAACFAAAQPRPALTSTRTRRRTHHARACFAGPLVPSALPARPQRRRQRRLTRAALGGHAVQRPHTHDDDKSLPQRAHAHARRRTPATATAPTTKGGEN